jgi:hypothetical protein
MQMQITYHIENGLSLGEGELVEMDGMVGIRARG